MHLLKNIIAIGFGLWTCCFSIFDLSVDANSKQLNFSGYTWQVRENAEKQGPGPNVFSANNVWVDDKGLLHLVLRKNAKTNVWECAEVSTLQKFGYGTYQWKIEGELGKLDKDVVFGLFNYSGNNKYDEMDIEFARWGNDAWPNLNYSVWPATGSKDTTAKVYSKDVNINETLTTHRFKRTENEVVFESALKFSYADKDVFEKKVFKSPETAISNLEMPIFINLWLNEGKVPSNGNEIEIVVHEFKYTPNR